MCVYVYVKAYKKVGGKIVYDVLLKTYSWWENKTKFYVNYSTSILKYYNVYLHTYFLIPCILPQMFKAIYKIYVIKET